MNRLPTYIERIAQAVWWASGETDAWYPQDEAPLWLGYAALCTSKRERTTSFDVHQVWSTWATIYYDGHHKSLIPFHQLPTEIQAYDDLYRDSIRIVAAYLGSGEVYGRDELPDHCWVELCPVIVEVVEETDLVV